MSAEHDDFRLSEWLVQPSLNRLSCGDRTGQIEPKMMDVLAFLAQRCGEVVTKQAIADAVWPDLFITESVITRAIAGLRRALGDDAKSPRFIETIPKRGYRLLAAVEPAVRMRTATAPPAAVARVAQANPYVAGQWVRGTSFYGRSRHMAEILDGQRNGLWLLGARCVGKTSLLRQLEQEAATEPVRGGVPVFWDLQGAEETAELARSFADAVLDAEPHLEAAGIVAGDLVEEDDLFGSLSALRRRLRAQSRRLLLLIDEAEELIHLGARDPSLLRKLRRALQSADGVRTVLASSVRLWDLARQRDDTSPFLHGFVPPLHLGPLDDDEAEALIRQTNLNAADRPALDDETVAELGQRCGNHPYLLQLACHRLVENHDLDRTLAEVAADPSVGLFFSVDMDLLEEGERSLLRLLAVEPAQAETDLRERLGREVANLAGSVNLLEALGLVCSDETGSHTIRCSIFRDWLRASSDQSGA